MSSHVFTGKLFGREVEAEYSLSWIAYTLVGLRIVMGWTLFQGALSNCLIQNGQPLASCNLRFQKATPL